MGSDPNYSKNYCPAGSGISVDEEFGIGTSSTTRCIERSNRIKVLVSIKQFCRDDVQHNECTVAHGLQKIEGMLYDYETVYGLNLQDIDVVVVMTGSGNKLLFRDAVSPNIFEAQIMALSDRGVRFYASQHALRKYMINGTLPPAMATQSLIEGIYQVTNGITAIIDLQRDGYLYYQP